MERHFKDLSGERFGELEVIRPTSERIQGYMAWECKCSCGNICKVSSKHLVQKLTKSCGHLKHEKHLTARSDITNHQFGDFIADFYDHNDEDSGYAVWRCHCSKCDRESYLTSRQLKCRIRTRCNHSIESSGGSKE